VGAFLGGSAIEALQRVGRQGLVVAIEPEPRNLRYLRMNLSRFPNSVVVPKAVSDRRGRVLLHRSPTISGTHSILIPRGGDCIEVEADTLDHICAELGLEEIGFMMMDVEGAEVKALRGARETLKRAEKVVVGAYHIVGGKPTWPVVRRMLERAGFRTIVTEDGLVHAWRL